MQMKPIAAGLASLGRGEDSVLVHMTPGEVHGLQALAMKHGGSLTINPHTGLPEAGFLSSILPMVAGVALNAAFPGSGALIGLGLGGLTALTSGSLSKGLMAGLGAYGGAGLGAGLENISGAAASAEAAKEKLIQDSLQMVSPEETNLVAQKLFPAQSAINYGALPGDYGPSLGTELAKAGVPLETPASSSQFYSGPPELDPYKQQLIQESLARSAALPDVSKMSPWEKMVSGAQYAVQNPSAVLNKENMKYGIAAAAPLAPLAVGAMAKQPTLPGGITAATNKPAQYYNTQFTQTRNPNWGQPGEPYFIQSYSPGSFGPTYPYAQGGTIPDTINRYPQSAITHASYATSPQSPRPAEVLDGYEPKIDPYTGEQRMAAGGLSSLHEYAAGGRLLDGPGDGMSDSIPAVIKGQRPQRAALADGEFVVPADVVSHLGNGSTKAGAQRLYSMMDKVRQARTGTKKQGKQIDAGKFLPA